MEYAGCFEVVSVGAVQCDYISEMLRFYCASVSEKSSSHVFCILLQERPEVGAVGVEWSVHLELLWRSVHGTEADFVSAKRALAVCALQTLLVHGGFALVALHNTSNFVP